MLPIAFAVVIIGGMGNLTGAAIGSLVVGLADNFSKALFPEVSYFTLYAPMILILVVEPRGLSDGSDRGAMTRRLNVLAGHGRRRNCCPRLGLICHDQRRAGG